MNQKLTPRQRHRIETTISTQIRHYKKCLELTRHLDPSVFRAGMNCFRSEASLAIWLCTSCRGLDDNFPLRVMRTAKGREQVAMILSAITQGIYM